MKKESIGRLLLSLLTAFVMVVGVFGAAIYTDSVTWESADSPVDENVVAGEHEDKMSGIGEAPISAKAPKSTINSYTDNEIRLGTPVGSNEITSLLDLGILPKPSRPEQKEIEKSENKDSSSTQRTRAPGDVVDANGPYGTLADPYFEGSPEVNPLHFTSDIIGTGLNSDYQFRWDVTGDGVFDGPGTAPDYWGLPGETDYDHMFLDNNVGEVTVQAWDGTTSSTTNYGDALSTFLPPDNAYRWLAGPEPVMGNEMTPNEDITITGIGYYKGDVLGIDIFPAHAAELNIWDVATQTKLRQVLNPLPDPDDEILYYTVPDLAVTAGTELLVTIYCDGIGYLGLEWIPSIPHQTSSPDGVITIGDYIGTIDGPNVYPDMYNQGSQATILVDIEYEWIVQGMPTLLEDTADIFIDNIAPTGIDPQATVAMGLEGSDVGFTASLIDPGTDDDWEYRWDWGDGTVSNWFPVNKWAGGARVLVATSYYNNENQDIENYLYNILGDFATQIDQWNPGPEGTQGVPTLADLMPYDVVISAENVIMTLADRIALGDVLADYSDMGGNVVTTWVSDADDSFYGEIGILGRWRDDVYNIFMPDNLDFSSYTMTTVYDPGHPIMLGVNSISTYLSTWAPDVEADATRLADDTYGEPIIGYKDNPSGSGGRIVGLNLIPHSSVASGDYDQLLANAVKWASQQPDPAPLPMPIPLDVVYHTYADDHPTSITPFDPITACVEIRDDDHGITIPLGAPVSVDFTDFEGSYSWPAGWYETGTGAWRITQYGHIPTYVAQYPYSYYLNQEGSLYSPVFDFTGFGAAIIEWDNYWWADYPWSGGQDGYVEVSVNSGPWVTLWEHHHLDPGLETASFSIAYGPAAGQSSVQFRFRAYNYDDWYWEIDNIEILQAPVYTMFGLSIPMCTDVDIYNVKPSLIVPPDLVTVLNEPATFTIEGVQIQDPALRTPDEFFWMKVNDGTWMDAVGSEAGMAEDFEGGVMPTGWTQIQYGGTGLWEVSAYGTSAFEPPGTGTYYVEADSDGHIGVFYDVGLFTSAIDLSGEGPLTMSLDRHFQDLGGDDTAAIRAYSGGTAPGNWEMDLWSQSGVSDPFGGVVGATHAFDPSLFADPSEVYFELYYSTGSGSWDWSFGVDNIMLSNYDPGGYGTLPPLTVEYGDNGIYTTDLQIIDDDMLWDLTGSQPVFTGTPGTEDQWVSHTYIDLEVLDVEPTVSSISAKAEVDIILEIKHGDKHSSSADVTLYENGVQIAQETSYGKEKCGGIEEMTLLYTGGGTVTAYKADVTPLPGNLYRITPTGSYTKLKSNTKLYVNGVQVAEIHTSCSKPINIGDVHGAFTIVGLKKIMKTGPPAIIPATIEIGQGDVYEIVVEWNQGSKKDEKAYLWLRYADGKTKKLRQKLTPTNPTWTIGHQPFMSKILDTPIIFRASATDPGSDDLAFIWNWGDETPTGVHLYDNDDQTTAVDGRMDAGPVIFDQLPGRDPWFDRTANDQKSPEINPISVDETMLHSFKGKHKYSKCKGVSEMILEYAGGAGADITAYKADVTDNGDGTYTFTPVSGYDKLKSSTKIYVGGTEEADIHTSCSKPIDVGMVFGDFEIVGLNKIGAGAENFFEVMLKVIDDDIGDGYPSYQNFNNDGGYDMESISIDLR